mgnify:FL=1
MACLNLLGGNLLLFVSVSAFLALMAYAGVKWTSPVTPVSYVVFFVLAIVIMIAVVTATLSTTMLFAAEGKESICSPFIDQAMTFFQLSNFATIFGWYILFERRAEDKAKR